MTQTTLPIRRLLVSSVGPDIDPQLIRFASMLVRMGDARPRARQRSMSHSNAPPHHHAALTNTSSRSVERLPAASSSRVTDSELRFITHLPTAKGSPTATKAARRGLHAAVDQHIHRFGSASRAGCDVVRGKTASRLLTLVRDFDADLLLLGRAGWSTRQLNYFAMAASCPIWFLPANSAPVVRQILVAVDWTRSARESLRTALHLARHFPTAKCSIVHVDQQVTPLLGSEIAPLRRKELMKRFGIVLRQLDSRAAKIRPIVTHGSNPGRVIARLATELSADLVVMSTRGRTRLTQAMLPSTVSTTLTEFPGALLALRAARTPIGWRAAVHDWLSDGDASQFS